MKKAFLLLGLFLFIFVTTGCGTKNIDLSVEEIVDKVYESVDGEFAKMNKTELTNDNLSYYLGVESLDFKEGIASEPLINAIAHSVVVVRVNDGVDVEKTKAEIKEKVNPNKWVCGSVDPNNVIVDSIGDVIILIMDNTYSTQLDEGFKSLAES